MPPVGEALKAPEVLHRLSAVDESKSRVTWRQKSTLA
jgi:hypothetical protein